MFKDIYKGPFTIDNNYCYVWSANHVMTFNCLIDNEKLLDSIIEKLNYGTLDCYNTKYENEIIYINDCPVFLIRGWGHLTGSLNLHTEEAVKIQDDFCNWVVETLNCGLK